MMKLFATLFFLLVFSCLAIGQTTKLSVIWSADPNCHQSNSVAVKALKPVCSSVKVEDMTFQIIDLGGVSYAVTNRPVRDYLVASVQISNKTTAPVEVIAKRSKLGRFKSVEEYAADAKGQFGSAQSQDELRQTTFQESPVGVEEEGGIRAGLKKRDPYEVDYARGSIRRRPGSNIDEPEAPPTEKPAPSKVISELRIPQIIFDNVLKSKTLASGEKAAGHLVFKNPPDEKAYSVLYLTAGQYEFVFPTLPK